MFRVLLFATTVHALDNGLARTPPMGWRTWNAFENDVSQALLEQTIDEMTKQRPSKTWAMYPARGSGVVSLKDVGYIDVGLDDNWQNCSDPKAVAAGYSFHDADGNPIINTNLFPNMSGMVEYGHSKGLTMGWYMNNCDCSESKKQTAEQTEKQTAGDVRAIFQHKFDGVKLDGCGPAVKLNLWKYYLNQSTYGPIMVENCHWGSDLGNIDSECPYHFARTSMDITAGIGKASWDMMFLNLQTMAVTNSFARPGCWGYADMMQVGNFPDLAQSRTAFGAWVITSNPLVLSFDLRDEKRIETNWNYITNRYAIAVSQAYSYNDAGRLVFSWNPPSKEESKPLPSAQRRTEESSLPLFIWSEFCSIFDEQQRGWKVAEKENNFGMRELRWNPEGRNSDVDEYCVTLTRSDTKPVAKLVLCKELSDEKDRVVYQPDGQLAWHGGNAHMRGVENWREVIGGGETTTDEKFCLRQLGYDWRTLPALTLGGCEDGESGIGGISERRWSIGKNGMLIGGNGGTNCLAVKQTSSLQLNKLQLWAKALNLDLPQANDLKAMFSVGSDDVNGSQQRVYQGVFVLNGDSTSVHPVHFSAGLLKEVFSNSPNCALPGGKSSLGVVFRVADLWALSEGSAAVDADTGRVQLKEIKTGLTDDMTFDVGSRDSRFFVIEGQCGGDGSENMIIA